MEISVVIPALNEEAGIEGAVAGACRALDRFTASYEVIVVDDGSSDGTAAKVELLAAGRPAVRLIRQPGRTGYGAALLAGFGAARHEYLFFTDADSQFDLNELEAFFPLMRENEIACGYRADKKYGWFRNFTSAAYNALAGLLLRPGVRDVNCAFKLMKRGAVQSLGLRSRGFFINAELLAKARRRGLRVAEAPVSHFPRTAGESKVSLPGIMRTIAEMTAFLAGGSR